MKDKKYNIIQTIINNLSFKRNKETFIKIYDICYKIKDNRLLKTTTKIVKENEVFNILFGLYLKSFKILDKKYTDATT